MITKNKMNELILKSEEINKEYKKLIKKRHRTSHCYKCKEPLSSTIHEECSVCHWLICKCGTCGCGSRL